MIMLARSSLNSFDFLHENLSSKLILTVRAEAKDEEQHCDRGTARALAKRK